MINVLIKCKAPDSNTTLDFDGHCTLMQLKSLDVFWPHTRLRAGLEKGGGKWRSVLKPPNNFRMTRPKEQQGKLGTFERITILPRLAVLSPLFCNPVKIWGCNPFRGWVLTDAFHLMKR